MFKLRFVNFSINEYCITRIPSGIWSRLYGWLLWMCVPRIGIFPSALNTWSKVWPWILIYISLFNLKLCTHIWSTNINFRRPPPYIWLFGPSWSELSPYGWIRWGEESIGPPTFFCHRQKRDYLSRASQRARGATLKNRQIFSAANEPAWPKRKS